MGLIGCTGNPRGNDAVVAVDQIEGVFSKKVFETENSQGGEGNPDYGDERDPKAVDGDAGAFRRARGCRDDVHFVTQPGQPLPQLRHMAFNSPHVGEVMLGDEGD